MKSSIENIKLKCSIEPIDQIVCYKLELLDELNNHITTLEYSDITNQFNELLNTNEQLNIYNNIEDIYIDLAQAKLNRFKNKSVGNDKIEVLLSICSKDKHQNTTCDDLCIHCNPHLGSDPFPNFFTNSMNEEIN